MTEILKDPIYHEVEKVLDELGVEAFLFDLDDSLIYTSEIFTQYMMEYSEVVAEKIGVTGQEIMAALKVINDEEYKKMGVNPNRWAAVVEKLAVEFGQENEEEITESLSILMKIYHQVPRMRRGAKIVLDVIKKSGRKIVLVTHANVNWTYFKLDMLGLWDYFDAVIIVDENGHKKEIDWKRGNDAVEVTPENSVVVGDSLGGDIRPGNELGARTIYMPSPWSVYRQGEVPERTKVIDEIFEVLEVLKKMRKNDDNRK